jgi:hypothetical protein
MTEAAKPRMRDGLIKRGDSWYFVLDQPRDPATGKRRQKWVKGGRTRKEAESARDEARDRKGNRGGWKAPSKLLLGEYLMGTWLPSIRSKVAPSTFTSYRQNLTHVADRIGHVRLDALDAPTLDALYADLEASGLARSTTRLIHTQLHRALADAVRWDLLIRNPSNLVDPPKPGVSSSPGQPASSAPSSRVSPQTGWPPCTSSPRRPGCGSVSWWGLNGPRSTWTASTSRSGGPRPPLADDGSSWTRPRSPCCGHTEGGRRRSGWPSAPGTATTAGCSHVRVVSR